VVARLGLGLIMSGIPAWFRSPAKWQEDDALTHDRELIYAAWLRLYGIKLEDETLVEEYDGGDCNAQLFESGRIAVRGMTSEIRELSPEAERPKRGAPVVPIFKEVEDLEIDLDRQEELRAMVRGHIAHHVREEISGGELFMKEVWEETTSAKEREFVVGELRDIVDFLVDSHDEGPK
jgi:hypothetical protein